MRAPLRVALTVEASRPEAYFRLFGWSHPARAVAHVAGRRIRAAAERHFRGRLLEIGCGAKQKALLVGDLVAEHVGLDHPGSPHGTAAADLVGTAYAIPAADACFDCALSTAVLEHLEEPEIALREARRVLRPGGVAVFTAPLFWPVHEAPRDFYRYTRFGLEHLLRKAGFEVLELEPLAGFFTTAAALATGYLARFGRGRLRPLVALACGVTNATLPRLDALPRLRDERFTWMYLIVARRPAA